MTQRDTKDRILDAAEELFASDGYVGTSLRGITTAADVNLAAVNYHFGSKEGLLAALFERRLVPLNKVRLENIETVLREAEQKAVRPSAGEVMKAFLIPTLEFKRNAPGARHFARMIWRAFLGGDRGMQESFLTRVAPVMQRLLDGLSLALPGIPREVLAWRLRFAMGAAGQVMVHDPEQPALMTGLRLSEKVMQKELLEFVIGGLEAPHED